MSEEELRKIRMKKQKELEAKIRERMKMQEIDHPLVITDETFEEVIRKYPLVVVDFWAPWCPPCRMIAPIIEELAKKYAGRVVFGKLNTDENMRTAASLGIMAVPTLMIYKDGRLVDQIIGALPKKHLEARIEKWL
ncbi:thioredoxin [Candidatus Alkanophaga liquidiphilum]|nr:Chaperedoxin CnoX [Candidatus Alkanophaga liquidiphilum]RLG37820.1 MAG: thioredoxin [Candidatus Alkanophagales archaeon]